jgi:regulator of protease activity HflC (stomatin/prohibitin superfamily)
MFIWRTITVGDQERALVTRRNRFVSILEPGAHRLFGFGIEVEMLPAGNGAILSGWTDFLVKRRPELVAELFTLVETRDDEVALIFTEGKLTGLQAPSKRALYWKEANITFERVDTARDREVPPARLAALERFGLMPLAMATVVEEGRAGLLFVDNRFVRTLEPGRYAFWRVAGTPRVEAVDVRRQMLEVAGQEILTRDKVSLRVNILAEYQVTDPVAAKTKVKDFAEQLYRVLQLAVRQTLGKRTLEQVLDEKTDVDAQVVGEVRDQMEPFGVRVFGIALKDIVLPGDMREILNRVVTAEKEAQANLIRRREETAATRSLLNTAKLMEDNPVLVRLKELETLEKLTAKVDRITVSGGFEGLLDNLLEKKGA